MDAELCDAILVDRKPDALTLLCSETKPDNQLYVRWRRFTLCKTRPQPEPLPGTKPPPPSGEPYELLPDEAFHLQHREFDLTSRSAGPLFVLGEQVIHPTQVSTTVDYGATCSFWPAGQFRGAAVRRHAPLGADPGPGPQGYHRHPHLQPR